MPTDHYLPDSTYLALVERLLAAAADNLDPRSRVMEALGEVAGIWPDSVREESPMRHYTNSSIAVRNSLGDLI